MHHLRLCALLLLLVSCGEDFSDRSPKAATATHGGKSENVDTDQRSDRVESSLSRLQVGEASTQRLPVLFKTKIGMSFVLIPHGDFLMGSLEAEVGHRAAELLHRVVLTRAFYLSQFETTNHQFREFKREHYSGGWKYRDFEVTLNGDLMPVVNVTHAEAKAFAEWLTAGDPLYTYRLPTAAEWEYACRAGTTSARYWGDGDAEAIKYENVWSQRAKDLIGWPVEPFPGEPRFLGPAPVGSFLPNPWGLYDMLGNVSEWSSDWGCPDPPRTPEDIRAFLQEEDPTGVRDDGASPRTSRTSRGGAWMLAPRYVRSAERHNARPMDRCLGRGFRLAAEPRKRS